MLSFRPLAVHELQKKVREMKKAGSRTERGMSLIEVIVVVLIISILVVFAVAQFGEASTVFETQNVARELKVNIERARFDSVKRRPELVTDMSRIVLLSSTSFSVSIDLDQDGVLENTETRTIDYSGRSNVRIVGQALTFPVTMVFDRRGHVTTTDGIGTEISPLFIICDGCTSFLDADNPTSYFIRISPTGTVSMYDNGQMPASVQNPTVTSVNSNTSIEPLVSTAPGAIDLTGVTGFPVPPPPSPSPSPTASPSPVPTVTPTPTSTPIPTPTPSQTPPPVACARNERPATTGCVCMPPMSVNGSGRCR